MDYLSHCLNCPTNVHCCMNKPEDGFVAIGLDDAKKIKEATGLKYPDFLDFSKLQEQMIADCSNDPANSEGKLRHSMMIDGRILRLKIKPNSECIFLGPDKKCTIYEIRPNICRIYPFWFTRNESDDIKITLHDSETECGVALAHRAVSMLPASELHSLKETARKIEAETVDYKKNILKFAAENMLLMD